MKTEPPCKKYKINWKLDLQDSLHDFCRTFTDPVWTCPMQKIFGQEFVFMVLPLGMMADATTSSIMKKGEGDDDEEDDTWLQMGMKPIFTREEKEAFKEMPTGR